MVSIYHDVIITICNDGAGYYPVVILSPGAEPLTLKILRDSADQAMAQAKKYVDSLQPINE